MSIYDSIVITGGGGMLAHALRDALQLRGLSPATLSHGECDINNHDDLGRLFERHPTLVLNCAAYTKVDLCEQDTETADAVNGYAVGELAKFCCRHGRAILVHVSTDFVFDGTSRSPYKPDDDVNPLSAYGRSKLLGEKRLQLAPYDDWLMVRTAWVYGRGGANFPRTMVTAARAGRPLSVINDQIGSPTYTVDLAEGILALLDKNARGTWHLTNSGQTSWFEFARAALAEFGIQHEVTPLTSEQWREIKPNSALRPAYSVLDVEPYKAVTGREMRPWRAALADYRAAVEREGF